MCAPTTFLQSRVYDHRSPACFPFPSSVCTYVIEYVSSRLSRSFTANSTIRFHATLPTLSNSPTCFDPLDGNPDRIRVICWDILVASGERGVTSRSAASLYSSTRLPRHDVVVSFSIGFLRSFFLEYA